MIVKTPKDLGLVLKDRRRALKLSQADLARRIGVSRYWVIDMEHGKGSAELGLVLRAASALKLTVDLSTIGSHRRPAEGMQVDIDAIVSRARGGKTE